MLYIARDRISLKLAVQNRLSTLLIEIACCDSFKPSPTMAS